MSMTILEAAEHSVKAGRKNWGIMSMTEKRLIDANVVLEKQCAVGICDAVGNQYGCADVVFVEDIIHTPTVDAVEVEDKELLKAIKLLIKQYDRSKASDYVHDPVAHALYHTWKQVDEGR